MLQLNLPGFKLVFSSKSFSLVRRKNYEKRFQSYCINAEAVKVLKSTSPGAHIKILPGE